VFVEPGFVEAQIHNSPDPAEFVVAIRKHIHLDWTAEHIHLDY
jgi:hypothetical protein